MRILLYMLLCMVPLIFVSCGEEEEINPRIETTEARAASGYSITAKGSIKEYGAYEIIDYGFAYNSNNSLFGAQELSQGKKPSGNEFSGIVPIDQSYYYYRDEIYVAAYIKNTKGVVYGNLIKVTIPRVSIGAVTPLSGKAGDQITITGSNFSDQAGENKIYFNETPAKVVSATPTKLIVEVPENIQVSSWDDYISISMEALQGHIYITNQFTLLPEFSSFSPQSGSISSMVTIYGNNLYGYYNSDYKVYFGDKAVSIYNRGTDYISVYVPDNLTEGSYTISVLFKGHKTSLPGKFTLKGSEITGISTSKGIPGDEIVLYGENFYPGYWQNTVYFDNTTASIQRSDNNNIYLTIPLLAPGNYTIKLQSPSSEVSYDQPFEILSPEITSFSPLSGGPESEITIKGKNFSSSYLQVTFGTKVAGNIHRINSETIVATVPFGVTLGENDLSVTSGGVKVIASEKFNYEGVKITDFTPQSGEPGTVVTINGFGFGNYYYSNSTIIKFGAKNAKIISWTKERIIVEVPEISSGNVKITAVANGEAVISEQEFQVLPK